MPAVERSHNILPRSPVLEEVRARLDVAISARDATVEAENLWRPNNTVARQGVRGLAEGGAARDDNARRSTVRLTNTRTCNDAQRDER